MIVFLAIVGLVASLVSWYYVKDRKGKCGACEKPVWASMTDCSPSGPNPLGVRCRLKSYHCKKCGEYAAEYVS